MVARHEIAGHEITDLLGYSSSYFEFAMSKRVYVGGRQPLEMKFTVKKPLKMSERPKFDMAAYLKANPDEEQRLARLNESMFPNEKKYVSQLRTVLPNYEDLIVFAARLMHTDAEKADEIQRQSRLITEYELAIGVFATEIGKVSSEAVSLLLGDLAKVESAGAQSILAGINRHKSRTSKSVVSQRIDQRLKPLWIQHCKSALAADVEIKRLGDLYAFNGCSADFKKNIDERTLKRWAKEVGVVLKAGRPTKAHK